VLSFSFEKEMQRWLRKEAPTRYLVALFQPVGVRDAYTALAALRVELDRITTRTSQSNTAAMRLAFWKDNVQRVLDNKTGGGHSVLEALSALRGHDVTRSFFTQLFTAYQQSPVLYTTHDVNQYMLGRVAPFYYLHLELLSLRNAKLDHAIGHVAVADGTCQLIQNISTVTRTGQCHLPHLLMNKHGCTQEDLYRKGPHAHGIQDVVLQVATIARDHLRAARDHSIPNAALPAFISSVVMDSFLGQLEQVDFDAFHPSIQHHKWTLAYRMWSAYQQGRF
jgi:NADH dehydrogenase [ubiquinone] 1 alpha subcomplex assembly factor 6